MKQSEKFSLRRWYLRKILEGGEGVTQRTAVHLEQNSQARFFLLHPGNNLKAIGAGVSQPSFEEPRGNVEIVQGLIGLWRKRGLTAGGREDLPWSWDRCFGTENRLQSARAEALTILIIWILSIFIPLASKMNLWKSEDLHCSSVIYLMVSEKEVKVTFFLK